ncbi:MAG: hypothetical protein IPJ81_17040 [Chitinophagaceae bacterium]|nr:hypothetical protein [Chitinophagaceae bacterium]
MAFGTAESGTWKMINDTLVEFKFNSAPPNLYALYGRHNNNIGDSIRIFFQEFSNSESLIHLGKFDKDKLRMKRIFNKNPNCLKFPNVYTVKSDADSILFAHYQYWDDEKWELYTFKNDEKYNDFIAVINDQELPTRPFYANIRKNGLYFLEEKKFSRKVALDTDKETAAFVNEIVNFNSDPDTLYFNPYYKEVREMRMEEFRNYEYTYDKQKEAFIAENYTSENGDDDTFDNMRVLYSFKAIRKFSVSNNAKIHIEEVPIFNFSCE